MKICCIPVNKIPDEISQSTNSFKISLFSFLNQSDILWIERKQAEQDFRYKQIIPYVLVKNYKNEFACYQRKGTETRLHGLFSCGIGGHIDEPDIANNLEATIKNGMFRELNEEFIGFKSNFVQLKYLGLINETKTDVGKVHIGIVYLAECINLYEPTAGEELGILSWETLESLKKIKKEFWTELALNLL